MIETRFKPLQPGIRMAGLTDDDIYYANKSGKAYGFHIDNAFIGTGAGVGRIQADGRPGGPLKRSYRNHGSLCQRRQNHQ